MKYEIKEITYQSTNKIDTIHAKLYIPHETENIKAVIQVCHGMCEHMAKYHRTLDFFASHGYLVCMHDHLGHGEYVDASLRGYFAEANGYRYLVEDVYQLTKLVKKEYPSLPYYILGHSMGSFIARCYMYKYTNKVDGYIIMGTGGPNPLVDAGIQMAKMIIARKGPMFRSKFLTDMVIGKFNEKFKPNVSKHDWLSSDESMLPYYIADKIGDFNFTASGYLDLFHLQKNANLIKNIQKVPSDLPVILLSGDMDPVGDSGNGVLEVYHNFIKTGHTNTNIKLYPYLRHELLNEIKREEVQQDMMDWITLQSKNLKDKLNPTN